MRGLFCVFALLVLSLRLQSTRCYPQPVRVDGLDLVVDGMGIELPKGSGGSTFSPLSKTIRVFYHVEAEQPFSSSAVKSIQENHLYITPALPFDPYGDEVDSSSREYGDSYQQYLFSLTDSDQQMICSVGDSVDVAHLDISEDLISPFVNRKLVPAPAVADVRPPIDDAFSFGATRVNLPLEAQRPANASLPGLRWSSGKWRICYPQLSLMAPRRMLWRSYVPRLPDGAEASVFPLFAVDFVYLCTVPSDFVSFGGYPNSLFLNLFVRNETAYVFFVQIVPPTLPSPPSSFREKYSVSAVRWLREKADGTEFLGVFNLTTSDALQTFFSFSAMALRAMEFTPSFRRGTDPASPFAFLAEAVQGASNTEEGWSWLNKSSGTAVGPSTTPFILADPFLVVGPVSNNFSSSAAQKEGYPVSPSGLATAERLAPFWGLTPYGRMMWPVPLQKTDGNATKQRARLAFFDLLVCEAVDTGATVTVDVEYFSVVSGVILPLAIGAVMLLLHLLLERESLRKVSAKTIWKSLRASEEEVVEAAGADAAIFLTFIRLGGVFSLITVVFNSALLMPLVSTAFKATSSIFNWQDSPLSFIIELSIAPLSLTLSSLPFTKPITLPQELVTLTLSFGAVFTFLCLFGVIAYTEAKRILTQYAGTPREQKLHSQLVLHCIGRIELSGVPYYGETGGRREEQMAEQYFSTVPSLHRGRLTVGEGLPALLSAPPADWFAGEHTRARCSSDEGKQTSRLEAPLLLTTTPSGSLLSVRKVQRSREGGGKTSVQGVSRPSFELSDPIEGVGIRSFCEASAKDISEGMQQLTKATRLRRMMDEEVPERSRSEEVETHVFDLGWALRSRLNRTRDGEEGQENETGKKASHRQRGLRQERLLEVAVATGDATSPRTDLSRGSETRSPSQFYASRDERSSPLLESATNQRNSRTQPSAFVPKQLAGVQFVSAMDCLQCTEGIVFLNRSLPRTVKNNMGIGKQKCYFLLPLPSRNETSCSEERQYVTMSAGVPVFFPLHAADGRRPAPSAVRAGLTIIFSPIALGISIAFSFLVAIVFAVSHVLKADNLVFPPPIDAATEVPKDTSTVKALSLFVLTEALSVVPSLLIVIFRGGIDKVISLLLLSIPHTSEYSNAAKRARYSIGLRKVFLLSGPLIMSYSFSPAFAVTALFGSSTYEYDPISTPFYPNMPPTKKIIGSTPSDSALLGFTLFLPYLYQICTQLVIMSATEVVTGSLFSLIVRFVKRLWRSHCGKKQQKVKSAAERRPHHVPKSLSGEIVNIFSALSVFVTASIVATPCAWLAVPYFFLVYLVWKAKIVNREGWSRNQNGQSNSGGGTTGIRPGEQGQSAKGTGRMKELDSFSSIPMPYETEERSRDESGREREEKEDEETSFTDSNSLPLFELYGIFTPVALLSMWLEIANTLLITAVLVLYVSALSVFAPLTVPILFFIFLYAISSGLISVIVVASSVLGSMPILKDLRDVIRRQHREERS